MSTFSKMVTSAGTGEALKSSEYLCESFIIQAKSSNTGKIYVSDSSSVANDESDGALVIEAKESLSFPDESNRGKYDLRRIYINAETSNEGVNVFVLGGPE